MPKLLALSLGHSLKRRAIHVFPRLMYPLGLRAKQRGGLVEAIETGSLQVRESVANSGSLPGFKKNA